MTEEQIFQLYMGLPQLIPDKIECKLMRCGNSCELVYREFFTYIPSDIADVILLITKKAMEFMWGKTLASIKLKKSENGVEIRCQGELKNVVKSFLITEALLFAAQNQEEANAIIEDLRKTIDGLFKKKLVREWNEIIGKELKAKVKSIKNILKMQKN